MEQLGPAPGTRPVEQLVHDGFDPDELVASIEAAEKQIREEQKAKRKTARAMRKFR